MSNDPPRPSFWQTVPGFMTASAAFLAALSGLLGGLNQIGVFDRIKTPPPATVTAPGGPPAANPAPGPPAAAPSRDVAAAPLPRTRPAPARPSPAPPPPPAATRPAPAPAPAPAPSPAPGGSVTPPAAPPPAPPAAAPVTPPAAPPPPPPAPATPTGALPAGTRLELAAESRMCSTSDAPGTRFNGAIVVPVTGSEGLTLPIGTLVSLSVTRQEAPTFIGAQPEAVIVGGKSYPLTGASARVTSREIAAGASATGIGVGMCIPAGGRITVTLGSEVAVGR